MNYLILHPTAVKQKYNKTKAVSGLSTSSFLKHLPKLLLSPMVSQLQLGDLK